MATGTRRLSKSDIEKMKPTELRKALNESVSELKALDRQSFQGDTAALQATLDELRQEMKLNREERAQAQKELSVLRSVVNQQQAFIEYTNIQKFSDKVFQAYFRVYENKLFIFSIPELNLDILA